MGLGLYDLVLYLVVGFWCFGLRVYCDLPLVCLVPAFLGV